MAAEKHRLLGAFPARGSDSRFPPPLPRECHPSVTPSFPGGSQQIRVLPKELKSFGRRLGWALGCSGRL